MLPDASGTSGSKKISHLGHSGLLNVFKTEPSSRRTNGDIVKEKQGILYVARIRNSLQ
jgi:hypothetical protein